MFFFEVSEMETEKKETGNRKLSMRGGRISYSTAMSGLLSTPVSLLEQVRPSHSLCLKGKENVHVGPSNGSWDLDLYTTRDVG